MSLLESMSYILTADVTAKASRSLHEPASATERGLAVALSTVLAGLSTIAATGEGGTLTHLLRNYAVESAVLDNLAGVFAGDGITADIRNRGQPAVDELFGQSAAAIESALAAFAGIKHSSAGSLLTMAVPVVLGFLARYQVRQGLSAACLAGVLAWQQDSVTQVLPESINSVIGFAPSIENTSRAAGLILQPTPAMSPTPVRRGGWSRPVLGISVALVLSSLLLLPRGCSHGSTPAGQSELANIRLSDGAVLSLQPNSSNYNLASFIESGSPHDLPKTFVLDRLDFEVESTQLTAESEPTIEALVAILRSSPNTAIALVGHATDSANAEVNDELALERANSVREILLDEGIDPKRVAAEGYEQSRPIRLSDSDAGRSENRQLELTVVRK